MPVKLNSAGGGSVTMDVGSTASNFTVTIPSATGTMALTSSVVSSLNGQTGAITNTSLYAIGSYIPAAKSSGGTVATVKDETIAGSSLEQLASFQPFVAANSYTNMGATGTWRALAPAASGVTAFSDSAYRLPTLWVRIS